MPESQPKQIGLLIGREWSWPSAFIAEVNQRGLDVTADFVKIGETRVDSPCPHDVIIDRMSHDIPYYRLYLKYAALNGCYVINNPFVMAADDKFFGLALARRLGLQVPRTAVLPNKRVEGENVPESFRNLVYPMDWQSIIDYVGVPAILKDVHTGGRRVAHRVGSVDELIRWYDESDTLSLVLQTIAEADQHVHCFVIGRQQVMLAAYSQADKRYQPGPPELDETTARQLKIAARELSEAYGYDLNMVEFVLGGDGPLLINPSNPAPDLDINLLTPEHFGWCVKAIADLAVATAENPSPIYAHYDWHQAVSAAHPAGT